MTDWLDVTRRNARSVQTTIGWIFWDPGAVARYEALGLPGPLGYIASRAAPLGAAGPEATIAAFGSISPLGIRLAFDLVAQHTTFEAVWQAAELGPALWPVVERLPVAGRVFFAAHLQMPRPTVPVLFGWHAVNCIREWRGDTHWAVVVAAGLDGVEAGILHNAWVNYERDWLPKSRGATDDELKRAWAALEARGLAKSGAVTDAGIALRQHIEDETDRLTTTPWELLGEQRALRFAQEFEPPCEQLLHRVDVTAGPNYQPASRLR
jgi:hypothetical protein